MYGGNQRQGYQYAIGRGLDIVVLLHGDGQYAPEVMQELLTPLENGTADMVMGSRMMIQGAALRGNMPMYKYFGNKVFTWVENTLGRTEAHRIPLRLPGLFRPGPQADPAGSMTWNWHFDTQIILEFLRKGMRIKEVPIPTYYGDEICHVNGIPIRLELHARDVPLRDEGPMEAAGGGPHEANAALSLRTGTPGVAISKSPASCSR